MRSAFDFFALPFVRKSPLYNRDDVQVVIEGYALSTNSMLTATLPRILQGGQSDLEKT